MLVDELNEPFHDAVDLNEISDKLCKLSHLFKFDQTAEGSKEKASLFIKLFVAFIKK